MAQLSQSQNDALRLACFLFNLEQEHGRDYLFGGERLGEAIDGFCRMTGLERPAGSALDRLRPATHGLGVECTSRRWLASAAMAACRLYSSTIGSGLLVSG